MRRCVTQLSAKGLVFEAVEQGALPRSVGQGGLLQDWKREVRRRAVGCARGRDQGRCHERGRASSRAAGGDRYCARRPGERRRTLAHARSSSFQRRRWCWPKVLILFAGIIARAVFHSPLDLVATSSLPSCSCGLRCSARRLRSSGSTTCASPSSLSVLSPRDARLGRDAGGRRAPAVPRRDHAARHRVRARTRRFVETPALGWSGVVRALPRCRSASASPLLSCLSAPAAPRNTGVIGRVARLCRAGAPYSTLWDPL